MSKKDIYKFNLLTHESTNIALKHKDPFGDNFLSAYKLYGIMEKVNKLRPS